MRQRVRDPVPEGKTTESALQEASVGTMAELLNDSHARRIIRETKDDPKPARELVDRCACSRPTVYRRLDQLQETGLLEESLQCQPDGNHRSVYQAVIDEITLTLGDQGFSVSIC